MPHTMINTSNSIYYLNEKNFQITSNFDCDIIEENKIFYKNILFPSEDFFNSTYVPDARYLNELKIDINDPQKTCPDYPNSDMDESCKDFKSKLCFKFLIIFIFLKMNLKYHLGLLN